jgi:serine/threonine protein kinase
VTYYFDMELCDITLASYIRDGNVNGLEPWQAIPQNQKLPHILIIVEEIVDGLLHIHGHHEVHRDLHPDNGDPSRSNLLKLCSAFLVGNVLSFPGSRSELWNREYGKGTVENC